MPAPGGLLTGGSAARGVVPALGGASAARGVPAPGGWRPPVTATGAGDTHPTRMQSYYFC